MSEYCENCRIFQDSHAELTAKNVGLQTTVSNQAKSIVAYQQIESELEGRLTLLENNNFPHAKPYMVCVPVEVWRKAFPALKGVKGE